MPILQTYTYKCVYTVDSINFALGIGQTKLTATICFSYCQTIAASEPNESAIFIKYLCTGTTPFLQSHKILTNLVNYAKPSSSGVDRPNSSIVGLTSFRM